MALCLLVWSQRGARADAQILNIPRVSGPPDLGGPPSSPEAGGAIVTDFRQYDPGDGVPCSRKTTASVSCDDDHLYVVFDCADEPGTLVGAVPADRLAQVSGDERPDDPE